MRDLLTEERSLPPKMTQTALFAVSVFVIFCFVFLPEFDRSGKVAIFALSCGGANEPMVLGCTC